MKKLLPNNLTVILVSAAFFYAGCGGDEPESGYVARVNDSYLYHDELAAILDTGNTGAFHTNEAIRKWINKELLYQTALNEGIVKDEVFRKTLLEAEKELAGAMLLKKIYEDEKFTVDSKELSDYFEKFRDQFKLAGDYFVINQIEFSDEDRAVQFRSAVLKSDWNKALNAFKADPSLIAERSLLRQFDYEIHPSSLYRLINELYPQEVSIIINVRPGVFTVVQLVEKFSKNSVPPLEYIRDAVENRYVALKREAYIDEYLKSLYQKNKIEIKNRE